MFNMDMTGVEETGDFSPAPVGTYVLKILDTKEGKSQRGHYQVDVTLAIAGGQYDGKKVWHKITFIPKGEPGAGFSKHWLKVIGQPYEGAITVNPVRWRGARLEADLVTEEYVDKEGVSKRKNAIRELRAVNAPGAASDSTPPIVEEKGQSVPF